MRILLFLIISCITFPTLSQKRRKIVHEPEVFASNEKLYEFDIKYLGESIHVDPTYQYVIGYLVELMAENPKWTLLVRGHVCCGPAMKVSKKRACKAYKLLIEYGIDKERLRYEGFSDIKPLIFPEKTEEDAAKNRRVDFLITIND